MKLESVAIGGRDVLNLEPEMRGRRINTTHLLSRIYDELGRHSVRDLAYSAQSYLARSLAQLAVEEAERLGVKAVGFSGGVAYNEHITSTIRRTVERAGLRFIVNTKVPAGDGGLAFGQVIVASNRVESE